MKDSSHKTETIVVERELSHTPEKVWRVLTESHLIEGWLQKNNFQPIVGHHFDLTFEWGVVDCVVRTVKPEQELSYTWESGALKSVIVWTLTPTENGTHLRMEQTGFRADSPEQARYFYGARAGWPRLFEALSDVLTKMQ